MPVYESEISLYNVLEISLYMIFRNIIFELLKNNTLMIIYITSVQMYLSNKV